MLFAFAFSFGSFVLAEHFRHHCSPRSFAGLAIDGAKVDEGVARAIQVVKRSGKVAVLEQAALLLPGLDDVFTEHCGIAHTRWATHGPANEV